jgi:hypothetical protein
MTPPRNSASIALALGVLLSIASCSSPQARHGGGGSRAPIPPHVARLLATPGASIGGESLLQRAAVGAFYAECWVEPGWNVSRTNRLSIAAGRKTRGPALGPDAVGRARDLFRGQGFAIEEGRSDWSFGPSDRDIQLEMLAGWAGAAAEMGIAAGLLDDWLAERRAHVEAARSQMRVGHLDFFAAPIGTR